MDTDSSIRKKRKKDGTDKEENRKKKERKERKKAKRKGRDQEEAAHPTSNKSSKKRKTGDIDEFAKKTIVNTEASNDIERTGSKSSRKKRKLEKQEKITAAIPTSTLTPTPLKERHPFEVDEADHCETPWRAYQDIVPVLDQIAKACGKTRQNLIIYDPYYCNGGIKRKLKRLGCHSVINENRDFYKNIKNGTIPPHDVLLTNPPYSGTHMESLLRFVSQRNTPFLLLLPHYVYTKPYFQDYFQSDARGDSSNQHKQQQLFYLVPPNRYAYEPPSWVDAGTGSTALARGKTQTAPFPSFWYCHVAPQLLDKGWLTQTFGASGERPSTKRPLQYASCTAHLPREFKGEFDVTNKRPNPRARKRAAAKKKQQPAAVLPKEQSPAGSGKRKKKRY